MAKKPSARALRRTGERDNDGLVSRPIEFELAAVSQFPSRSLVADVMHVGGEGERDRNVPRFQANGIAAAGLIGIRLGIEADADYCAIAFPPIRDL